MWLKIFNKRLVEIIVENSFGSTRQYLSIITFVPSNLSFCCTKLIVCAHINGVYSVVHCDLQHNGFFGLGCSSLYLVCVGGRPIYHRCQDGFTFNERTLTCEPKVLEQFFSHLSITHRYRRIINMLLSYLGGWNRNHKQYVIQN